MNKEFSEIVKKILGLQKILDDKQTLIDVLNGAVKVQAACYGTMSNITFGNKSFGYYETICGGEGASFGKNGTDAVHCHMTNPSITDAEIIEWNYPQQLMQYWAHI